MGACKERWRGRAKFKSGALPTQCRMPGANAASLFFPYIPPLDMTVLMTQSIKRLNTKEPRQAQGGVCSRARLKRQEHALPHNATHRTYDRRYCSAIFTAVSPWSHRGCVFSCMVAWWRMALPLPTRMGKSTSGGVRDFVICL